MKTTLMRVALTLVTAATSLWAVPSNAALKCEEIVSKRYCADSSPRNVSVGGGQFVQVPAPIISGYPTACWDWARKFQCVETDPKLWCDSGTAYPTVKRDCSLVQATIKATVSINGIKYITDADYSYRCAFGAETTNDKLPANKECVYLDEDLQHSDYVPSAPIGSDPGSASLTSSIPTTETRTERFVCYAPPVTTCANTCYEQVSNPLTGLIENKEVACSSPVTQCQAASTQCDGTVNTRPDGSFEGTASWGPDGRCVSSTEQQICQSGEIPRCLAKDNCQLNDVTNTSVQDNGIAVSQEQTYVCSNESVTCTEYANISNCVSPNAWGWDKIAFQGNVGAGLGEFNQAMSKLEGIEKGIQGDDPYIFSGSNLRCHFPVGNFLNTFIAIAAVVAVSIATGGATTGAISSVLQSTGMAAATANGVGAAISIGIAAAGDAPNSKAFGTNCCKDFVFEGSDKWYKLGSCNADEIKLSVAKRKGLTYYLGEYCSKKSGFPIRQCVQRTRSYCVFDDMLALVVNEQGRAQLDQIAAGDTANTVTTSALNFRMFNNDNPQGTGPYSGRLNTGRWQQLVPTSAGKSQVWAWQYPSYCVSQEAQAKAYDIYTEELNSLVDLKGTQPEKMTPKEVGQYLLGIVGAPVFQECPSTPGMMSFMTCSKDDDSCNASQLPEGPTGVEIDYTGEDISAADPNWRIQQTRVFFKPGDYGVTALMPTNSAFAARVSSVSPFVSSVGSCHTNGDCLFYFTITDKVATKGLGARKRVEEYAQFPLYSPTQSAGIPSVSYMNADGSFSMADYRADPNRGLGNAIEVSTQRFIFHPNHQVRAKTGPLHTAVLLEYANRAVDKVDPENDFQALSLPTSLPPGTPGWFPYGNGKPGETFYMSGGCDPNSRWCNYTIGADLNVPRHPWGSAKEARCWGFTLEQMAALDFDRMDLSRWINSLDLNVGDVNMSDSAVKAMADQVTNSAQSFYGAMKSGESTDNPTPGSQALYTSTDILPRLSNDSFSAFQLQAGVPSNWPQYYDDQENNNPVSNVVFDWGDGSPVESVSKHSSGRSFLAAHDYGDVPVGRYKVTVTLDTHANGPQKLTTYVTITPEKQGAPAKQELDFESPGSNGKSQREYTPSDTLAGVNQAPENLEQLAPGMAAQFDRQTCYEKNPAGSEALQNCLKNTR